MTLSLNDVNYLINVFTREKIAIEHLIETFGSDYDLCKNKIDDWETRIEFLDQAISYLEDRSVTI